MSIEEVDHYYDAEDEINKTENNGIKAVHIAEESLHKKPNKIKRMPTRRIPLVAPNKIERTPTKKVPINHKSGEPRQNNECFGNYTRFVILVISTLCLTCMISNSLAMNFSIICMNKENLSVLTIPLNIAVNNRNKTINGKFLKSYSGVA